jgi:hypothetical protein
MPMRYPKQFRRAVCERLVAGGKVIALQGPAYPRLSDSPVDFRDRLTGRIFSPTEGQLRDLVDLTLASESGVGLIGTTTTSRRNGCAPCQTLPTSGCASVREGFDRLFSTSGF